MTQQGRVELEAVARTEQAQREFRDLQEVVERFVRLVEGLAGRGIRLDAEGLEATRRDLEQLRATLASIAESPITLDTSAARREVESLEEAVDRLDDERTTVELDADGRQAVEELQRVKQFYERTLRDLRQEARRRNPFECLGEAAEQEAVELAKAWTEAEKRFDGGPAPEAGLPGVQRHSADRRQDRGLDVRSAAAALAVLERGVEGERRPHRRGAGRPDEAHRGGGRAFER